MPTPPADRMPEGARRREVGSTGRYRSANRWEYRSGFNFLGLPLVHIVIGRDPQTGRLGRAVGVIAIGRIAIGGVAIGQAALGIIPIGQVALGLFLAFGQLSLGGWEAFGQVAAASRLAVGQAVMAESAIGQVAVARYGICQAGIGACIHSMGHPSPEALRHFREQFPAMWNVIGGWIEPAESNSAPPAEAPGP